MRVLVDPVERKRLLGMRQHALGARTRRRLARQPLHCTVRHRCRTGVWDSSPAAAMMSAACIWKQAQNKTKAWSPAGSAAVTVVIGQWAQRIHRGPSTTKRDVCQGTGGRKVRGGGIAAVID